MCDEDNGQFSGYAADMWAFGVCMYAMLFGALPFVAEDPWDLFDEIMEKEIELPCDVSPNCAHFVHGLLNKVRVYERACCVRSARCEGGATARV